MTDPNTAEEKEQPEEAVGEKSIDESADDTENVKTEEVQEGEESEEKQEYEDTDTPDIPVRDNASYIIARKNKQIEKLRSKVDDEEVDEEVVDYSDDELTPESRTAVEKEVARQLAPLTNKTELDQLFAEEPDAKGYEKTIRAYMEHESYQNVPPKFIYQALANQKAEQRGANRRNAADLEAKQMSGTGSSHRPAERPTGSLPTPEEVDDMSDEEFEALEHKIRRGDFVDK